MGMGIFPSGGVLQFSLDSLFSRIIPIMSNLWRPDLSGGPLHVELEGGDLPSMPNQSAILHTDSPPDEVGMTKALIAMSEDCMRHLVAENDGKLVVVGARIQHPSVDKYVAILKLGNFMTKTLSVLNRCCLKNKGVPFVIINDSDSALLC